ncbi:MAG: NAD(P)-binding protein [Pseudorhodobacter sp.]|nr:NAD(P)-binding protein [Pseudorhodobacter sp.]
MSEPDVDVAILGGGCAGLSLAARLAKTNLSVQVIEPRTEYTNDRSWSFWRTSSDPFKDCVRREWSSWTIVGPGGETRRSSSTLRYQTIDAGAFYARAGELIADGPRMSLSLGVSASDVIRSGQGWRVETSAGTLTARTVVDTRPPRRVPTYGQFFLGREIRTERPVFNPEVVQLMHFRVARSAGVDFVYILPFSADHALVEVTSFAPRNPGHTVFADWLDAEIAALDAGGFQTLRTEAGGLPLGGGFMDPAPDGIIRMGLGGGAARPSTGYAFARIQAQAAQVASALVSRVPPRFELDSRATRFMDRVFLQVLRGKPADGPALFETLFRHAPRDRLERFLSGSTRASDRLSVMASLPPLPFLRAAAFPA